jgi:predicted esterase
VAAGLLKLDLAHDRDGHLLVPTGYDPRQPAPLVLALHGARGAASGPIGFLAPYAAAHGFLVLGVDSQSSTWDAIGGPYGPDVEFIDRALAAAFQRCAVDPARIAAEGFSDGASYALGLALANGDLFRYVVALSPGFIPRSDSRPRGRPKIFVAHGRQDLVLPIGRTSRRIVPALRQEAYDVTYVEHDGGHAVPTAVADQAIQWLLE